MTPSPRVILIVLDGCGAGAAPDAESFNDYDHPSTLLHIWEKVGGFHTPNLQRLGWLAAAGIDAPAADEARYGRLRPLSMGKDSVTGHWEMMGIVLEQPFPTFPDGFPISMVKDFERRIGTQTIGNRAASGTEIIKDLGPLHVETGFPILYTSADSVFQIACHEEVVPIERLYEMCRIGREVCAPPNQLQRVIARPFVGNATDGFTRTPRRKDFSVIPPPNLVDEIGDVYGIGVVPELFDGRGFRPTERTQSNPQHKVKLFEALRSDARFIFANFEDFDMLYGHRNDPVGFAKCLEEFDTTLGELLDRLEPNDTLMLTADHGNDPTDISTDHTREYSPIVAFRPEQSGEKLGDVDGLGWIARETRSILLR